MVVNSNKVAICIAGVLDSLPDVVHNLNANFLDVVHGDVFVYAPRSNSSSSTVAVAALDAVSKLKGVVDVRIDREDVSEAMRAEKKLHESFYHTINWPGGFLGCYDGRHSFWKASRGASG